MLMQRVRELVLFAVAGAIGYTFYSLNIPIPFMFAGLLIGVAGAAVRNPWNQWPVYYRNIGLMVVGYAIGSFVTEEACHDFVAQIGMIVASTLFMIVVGIFIAWVMAKVWHEDFMSCVLGMMPGGMSLVMVIVQEDKRYDPNVVMVMQIIRYFGVVFSLPFLVITLFDAHVMNVVRTVASDALHWLWFLPLALLGSGFFLKFHIPIPWLLGPVIPTAVCSMYYHPVGALPTPLLWAAQICVGISMGMMMDWLRIWKAKRLLPAIIVGTVLLIGASYFAATMINNWYGVDIITGFLAMAPGGISEMNIAGLSMGADVAIILAYQLLRVFAISWTIPLLIRFKPN